jgi:PAS domain S-box-containing protein
MALQDLELPSLLNEVLDASMALQGADFGDVQLYDEKSRTLRILAHRNLDAAYLDHFAVVDGSGMSSCGRALKSGERVIIEDVTLDEDFTPHRSIAAATGFRGVMSTPMFDRMTGKPLGMLSTQFREPYHPTERELGLADLFARQAADLISSRLAEQRLRESDEYFRLALAAGNMGTWEWNPEAQLISADETHQALFGLPPQDRPMPIDNYWQAMSPEQSEALTNGAIEALAAGSDIQLELPIHPSEGETRWISVRGRPRQGGSRSIIGISWDITSAKERERSLREHQAWLTAILDQLPGGIGVFNRQGAVVMRGGPLAALWGDTLPSSDPSSLARWRSFDGSGRLISFDRYPGARALRGDAVSPGMDFEYIGEGDGHWYRISSAPLRDESGAITGATVFIQDVDKERRAEEQLRQSEQRLKSAVELVGLGLYPVDIDDGHDNLRWDDRVKAMWGIRPDEDVTESEWMAAIHPDDRLLVRAAVERSYDPAGNGIYDAEYRVNGRDGVERWIATRGETRFEEGRPVSFLGVALDVTERKAAERNLEHLVDQRTRELERANATLQMEMVERERVNDRLELLQTDLFHASRVSDAGQMAGMIAHELSQPLAAIVNSVNAIRRVTARTALASNTELGELTEDVGGQAERAHEIIRRLRRFIQRGSPDRLPEPIVPLVQEAVAFATTGPEALGVSKSCIFDPTVASVLVDRVQIQQVITNLVRNSIYAMKDSERREFTVSTQRGDENMVAITVEDFGSGIDAHMERNLFEPFQSTKPAGMGLGLSICRTIVEAHRGEIEYRPAPGGGSSFTFTVPIAGKIAA